MARLAHLDRSLSPSRCCGRRNCWGDTVRGRETPVSLACLVNKLIGFTTLSLSLLELPELYEVSLLHPKSFPKSGCGNSWLDPSKRLFYNVLWSRHLEQVRAQGSAQIDECDVSLRILQPLVAGKSFSHLPFL